MLNPQRRGTSRDSARRGGRTENVRKLNGCPPGRLALKSEQSPRAGGTWHHVDTWHPLPPALGQPNRRGAAQCVAGCRVAFTSSTLDPRSTYPPVMTTKIIISRYCHVPGRKKSLLVENHCLFLSPSLSSLFLSYENSSAQVSSSLVYSSAVPVLPGLSTDF